MRQLPKGTLTFLCWPERIVVERLPLLRAQPLRYVLVSATLIEPGFATFHPLMGFTSQTSFNGLPVGISPSRAVPRRELDALAKRIGAVPFTLPKNRARYHAAAVLAGAGVLTTWLTAIEIAGIDPELLYPIAQQALVHRRITGPVARGDKATLQQHRAQLKGPLRAFYDAVIKQMAGRASS